MMKTALWRHGSLQLALFALGTSLSAQSPGDQPVIPAPSGWLWRPQGARLQYVLAADADTRIEVYPATRVDSRPGREWFVQATADARDGAALISQGTLTEERGGRGIVLLQGQLARGGRTGTRYRYAAGIEEDNWRLLVVLEAPDTTRFRSAVATFTALRRDPRLRHVAVAGVSPRASTPERAEAPTARIAADLAGGWYGTELRSQLNWATGGYSYQQITYFFVLHRDGSLQADAWGERTEGRWRLQGSALRLALASGTTYDLQWDRGQDRLALNGAVLERMRGEAVMLDGSYGSEAFADVSSFGGATTGGVSSSVRLRFLPNQRFTLESAVGVAAGSAGTGGAASQREMARGRYALREFRLRLQYDDGRIEERSAALPAAGGPRPAYLMLNGSSWLRR